MCERPNVYSGTYWIVHLLDKEPQSEERRQLLSSLSLFLRAERITSIEEFFVCEGAMQARALAISSNLGI